jgi:hypothetical protein
MEIDDVIDRDDVVHRKILGSARAVACWFRRLAGTNFAGCQLGFGNSLAS